MKHAITKALWLMFADSVGCPSEYDGKVKYVQRVGGFNDAIVVEDESGKQWMIKVEEYV
jgi:hypothetical protein